MKNFNTYYTHCLIIHIILNCETRINPNVCLSTSFIFYEYIIFVNMSSSHEGGYTKGQRSVTVPNGNRLFNVYLVKGTERNPLYKDSNEDTTDLKIFKGKSPKEVAKKVVTEICRQLKGEDPKSYVKICKSITSAEAKKRHDKLSSVGDDWAKIDLKDYPGFRFELIDVLNKTTDGEKRSYLYYGERMKLDISKKFKTNKFSFESNVIPIRKDLNFQQALLDHIIKSKQAKKRYEGTLNFVKHHKRTDKK